MPELNVDLIDAVLDHITAHPETWYQGQYRNWNNERSVPTYCFAGHAIRMAVADPQRFPHDASKLAPTQWWTELTGDASALWPNAETDTQEYAANLLGLTDDESYEVVYGSISVVNTPEDMRELFDDIRNNRKPKEVPA